MRSANILIIESDSAILQFIKTHLEIEGFEVHVFESGTVALEHYFDARHNLVILGREQTRISGIEICRQIRMFDQCTPIIMLGGRGGRGDAGEAFEAGADDYVTAPVSIRELSARVKTILQLYRRAQRIMYGRFGGRRIEINGLVIDSNVHRVTVGDATVNLTAKEFDLLYLLASNPGKVFSRRLLLDILWAHNSDIYEHTVNSHINRLRRKIEKNPRSPKYILTEWGFGYRFTDQWH
jgi:DNA-binding response OmpR family regulator